MRLAPTVLVWHDSASSNGDCTATGGHAEAVARIAWCIDQHVLGVVTGEVGAGKTVATRAVTAALDTSRHVVIYLPNPSVGVRGMLHHIVSALGQAPASTPPPSSPKPPTPSPPNTPNAAAPRS
jgi:type II secretory pathway predicted ATPase ExeA